MDQFLLRFLPLCHARVYKAVLQHKGQSVIPDVIKDLEEGATRNNILSTVNYDAYTRDIRRGIHQLIFINENKRLGFLHKLTTKQGITPLRERLDTILLQLVQSDRWSKSFKHDEPNYDLILAVPKWSRVVSLSTSEIQGTLEGVKQFDTLQLHGYHFYEFFNKLHGVTGRTVTIEPKDNIDRIKNLTRLSYLFRSCADLRMIAESGNLRLFTTVPDASGELRIGMFFMMICKIGNARETRTDDGRGINPFGFIVALSDQTGTIDARLNTSPGKGSMWQNLSGGYMRDEISGYLLSDSVEIDDGLKAKYKHVETQDFMHPQDLEKHNGSFLVMGSWFLGDDIANVTFATPLHTQANTKKFSMISYMNTRKRVRLETLREKFGIDQRDLSQPKPYAEFNSIVLDSKREWAYYTEQHWDRDVFLFMLENNIRQPEFHKILNSNIPKDKLYDLGSEMVRFFTLNEELKNLYLPDGKGLDEIYKSLKQQQLKIIVPAGSEKFIKSIDPEVIERALNLMPVKGWKKVERLCMQIEKHDFGTNDVFRWGNGGRPLEDGWERLRQKNWRSGDTKLTEIRSALHYIYQARGLVTVPEIIYDKTFGE